MLLVQDISKRYPGRNGSPVAAIDGVSLSVEKGQFVAVCGPSGSGKSTLLLAAGGLLSPDSGVVSFQGADIYGLWPNARAEWRSRCLGFVFQQFHLIPYLSVLENVLAPTVARPAANANARAQELLERFGLARRASHVPSELSVGEQQRTALARALFHRPDVLMCDEPTGNLDEQNAATALAALNDYRNEGGAVLLVTHHSGAAQMADTTIRLENGRVVPG